MTLSKIIEYIRRPYRITHPDGRIEYRENGVLHRDDGPAVILPDGREMWFSCGKIVRAV